MHLSPPTRKTFTIAVLLMAIGLAARLLPDLVTEPDVAFGFMTVGATLLLFGTMFNKV